MIPSPKEMQRHAFGIVDPDNRLRFLVNAASDAARLAEHLSGLAALAVEEKLRSESGEGQSDG